jgi:adapter protein MecA 1/2
LKIEKINDNQIRCTLTKNDLAERAIKLSELTYGSEKAKTLFRDMMRQAQKEFGFHAEDIPLMIEAIPYSEHVVLIITKVEDPEELDTKFSNFAPGVREDDPALDDMINDLSGAAEVLDLFKKIQDSVLPKSAPSKNASDNSLAKGTDSVDDYDEEKENPNLTRMFTFSTLSHINKLARLVGASYNGVNSLYKDDAYGTYILIVTKGSHSKEEYNRFCNMVSEYGSMHKSKPATERFLEEHFAPIIKDNALQTLAEL